MSLSIGEIEVETKTVRVLNEASRELPFTTATKNIKNEELRLRYRYLDLRRAELQQNLVARSAIVSGLREVSERLLGFHATQHMSIVLSPRLPACFVSEPRDVPLCEIAVAAK